MQLSDRVVGVIPAQQMFITKSYLIAESLTRRLGQSIQMSEHSHVSSSPLVCAPTRQTDVG